MAHHAPCQCNIIPSHLLRRIAQHGSVTERTAALGTLALDESIRLARATYQLSARGDPHGMLDVAAPVLERTIYDAGGREMLPGTVARHEAATPSKDVAVNEAYDGLGATFEFFRAAYERNSIDDQGMHLDATVHYGRRYDNAFWNARQMVFGDGDGELFNRFTIALDVIGHELTHGVTGSEVNLAYTGQSGALNESVSDVFGSLVKQYAHGQSAADADWLIGAGLFTARVHGVALRSLKAPGTAFDDPVLGKDEQPAHMRDYVHTTMDNGGVHMNSGIPNHAFYLLAMTLGGHAWEKAGRIWYDTLRDRALKPTATFSQFARATASHARHLFGAPERKAVVAAWADVGVRAG